MDVRAAVALAPYGGQRTVGRGHLLDGPAGVPARPGVHRLLVGGRIVGEFAVQRGRQAGRPCGTRLQAAPVAVRTVPPSPTAWRAQRAVLSLTARTVAPAAVPSPTPAVSGWRPPA
ncbi:hypothetical protein GR130_26690 [Streptomyces sp. GS7]|nr:hypothetical protein GR130_26690 [Streptomyces sp. GS7]